MSRLIRVVAMSDTHNSKLKSVPPGDLLIHAGDLTGVGTDVQMTAALDWLGSLPHPHKVVVAGNHDFVAENDPDLMSKLCSDRGIVYLCRSLEVVEGLAIWGSPWTPRFFDWAFMYGRGNHARSHWLDVPEDLDILVTHGPPFGMGDRAMGRSVGCVELLERVLAMRAPPRAHVFGHIHSDRGEFRLGDDCRTRFYNVATDYARHPATTFDLEVRW